MSGTGGPPSGQAGLLLATMEPSPGLEEEFQQWYDTEHFPERRDTPGFRTAARFACLSGWPRYLALYDLDDPDVLSGPDYAKIAGCNYSRWTSRVVGRAWGHYRAGARQVYPGGALLGQEGRSSRLALWRFRQAPPGAAPAIIAGLREIFEERPEVAQVRVFETDQPDGTDCLGIIEQYVPWMPPDGAVAALGDARRHLDLVNEYTRYERHYAGHPPAGA